MSSMVKFWLWLIFFIVLSVFFVKWAKSQGIVPEMLVQHSPAYVKNKQPQGNISELFDELGRARRTSNPCIELEAEALRYCTPHSIQLLLSEHIFVPVEDQLLRKFLGGTRPCDDAAEYIGRICKQENFKKIFKHFALKK